MMQKMTALILLLALGMIWGSGYVIAKFATENGVPPLGYSFWQSLGPAMVLLAIAQLKDEMQFSWKYIQYYLVCGLIGIAIPNSVIYFSASHLPAGLLSVLVNTVPIITFPLALIAGQERFDWKRFAAILIGIVGILLLILPKASLPSPNMISWALLALIAPICFALCSIYINRNRPENTTPLTSSAGMLLCAGLFLIPAQIGFDSYYPLLFPFAAADWAIVLEIILSSIGYVLFFKLIQIAGPVYYSLVGGVVCITGLFWGYLLYNETLNSMNLIAIGAILLAIAAISATTPNSAERQ
jgi:drug/metabolite transporter (DMT)-like permease